MSSRARAARRQSERTAESARREQVRTAAAMRRLSAAAGTIIDLDDPPPDPELVSDVPGIPGLTAPVPRRHVEAMLRHARAHPWPGNRPLTCPAHRLDTYAILDPGRPIRLLLSVDVGYHSSGWFANSDYESCLHLSVSHPRNDRMTVHEPKPELGMATPYIGPSLEVPADDEVRAWGRVFYGAEHASKSWFEPAASIFDPYRSAGVVHLRLFLNREGRPFIPAGEPYNIRPWADGSSPAKVTDGRLGADVR